MTALRSILICGGAGYTGSHMCKRLIPGAQVAQPCDSSATNMLQWQPCRLLDYCVADTLQFCRTQ